MRRLVNSYCSPLKAFLPLLPSPCGPFGSFSSFFSSHLTGVKIIFVRAVKIYPQVVRKRNRGRTGERQKEGYTKVKSSERSVLKSQCLCVDVCDSVGSCVAVNTVQCPQSPSPIHCWLDLHLLVCVCVHESDKHTAIGFPEWSGPGLKVSHTTPNSPTLQS